MVESVGAFRPAGTIPPGTSDDTKVGGPKANVPKGVGGDGGDAPPVSSEPGGPGIGAPNPAPPKPGTSDPSSVASTLSQFASNAPSIQQIAQIIQDANLRAREAARLDRQASRDAEQQALHSAADKIRDEANFNLGAAIATSALAIAGAAMTIGGALKAQSIRSEAISEAEPLKTEFGQSLGVRRGRQQRDGGGAPARSDRHGRQSVASRDRTRNRAGREGLAAPAAAGDGRHVHGPPGCDDRGRPGAGGGRRGAA